MSRLLDLPPELRLTVFELVVASSEPVIIPLSGKKARPALLHVSRQIHSEAIKAYYTLNSFQFLCDGETLQDLPEFAHAAGAENLSLIRSFTLNFSFSQQTLASNEVALGQAYLPGEDGDSGFCEMFLNTSVPCTAARVLAGELLMHGLRAEALGMSSSSNGQTDFQRHVEQVTAEALRKNFDRLGQIKDKKADLVQRRRELRCRQEQRELLLSGKVSPANIRKLLEIE